MIEIRWLKKEPGLKILQYRQYLEVGPDVVQLTEWKNVPEVFESEEPGR